MNAQPEALQIASIGMNATLNLAKCRDENKRLHALNQELLHWMQYIQAQTHIGHIHDTASAAITKAQGLLSAMPSPEPSQQQSCYCPNCEALSKELAALKAAQPDPVVWRSWNDHDGYGFWDTKQEAEPWCAPDFVAEPLCLCIAATTTATNGSPSTPAPSA